MSRSLPVPERRRPAAEPADRGRGYYDPEYGATMVKVLPGDHYVTGAGDEIIVTVLGSCVAACIRDPVAAVGGMNHFMLPGEVRGTWGGASNGMRYGQVAMERLINDLFVRGARRDRLEVKLFGGANVLRSSLRIGDNNALFAHSYLEAEGLPIAAEDLDGTSARRILYYPLTGRVMRLELRREPDSAVFENEVAYRAGLDREPVVGSVELFG